VHCGPDFAILGPLRICVNGTPVLVPAAKQRALLAALILHAGKTLVVDKLTDAVWDERPPRDARGAIQAYVMRLRQALDRRAGRRLIRTVPGGYLLDVEEEAVDAARFRRLTRQAERSAAAGRLGDASSELSAALRLWRGQPLEDVASDSLHRSEVLLLAEQRLFAAERRIEFELSLGRHREVVAELNALVAAYPLRERYWHLLMLALHQSGWRADALAAYRRARRLFIAELGIEPGDELRELHDAILADKPVPPGWDWSQGSAPRPGPGESDAREAQRGDWQPTSRPAAGQPAARVTWGGRPPDLTAPPARMNAWLRQCQLPRDIGDFVGRAEISEQIAADLCGSGPAVPVVALCGLTGVGKTALAIRVAHHVRGQFPDGQLYVRLGEHGSRANGLGRLLADLMLATGRQRGSIPDGLDQRAAAFRAWLADRRVLLVIENVASAAQVRPLLPATPGCAVMLTSRHDLRALTVLDGVRHYTLGALPQADALELLNRILGRRAQREPPAVAELAALCGYLPLALRLAAASLASTPGLGLHSYVARLREHGGRALAAVPAAGQDALDPALRRLLALLGEQHLPGGDADALMSAPADAAAWLLDHLAGPPLVRQTAPGGPRLPAPAS
jgi:DNA-binding SARP family transcriptional activator